MNKHCNEAVEGDDGGLVICRGCKATGTYAQLPSGECPKPYKPDSVLLKESLAREQALQHRLTAADEQIDLLTPRHTEQPEGKRERFEKWVMATKHPIYGFLDGRSLARGDDRTGYADEYVQGLWVAYLEFGAEQLASAGTTLDYGSLDAVQRLALCRGDVSPVSAARAEPDRIKGMIETVGGEYAVMIDQANGHYGWTFKKHPDGQWVSGRLATEAEMNAARAHAQITNQL